MGVRYEFAVTAGPGTLIKYGTCDESWRTRRLKEAMRDGHTIIIARAAADCETGK